MSAANPNHPLIDRDRFFSQIRRSLKRGGTLAVIDVSFISLRLILPAAVTLLKAEGDIIALVKPQFEVGKAEVFGLSSLPTLFSRYVMTSETLDETQFLELAAEQLKALDIPCRKMLGGITHKMNFPAGPVFTRSLMVAELQPEQSVRLQQIGLGDGRTIGCGLFLPHKGIAAVKEPDGE